VTAAGVDQHELAEDMEIITERAEIPINLKCNYETETYGVIGSFYQCNLQNKIKIISRESANMMISVSGTHKSEKGNNDVTGFSSLYFSDFIEYFPRNLENVFRNLKMIYIGNGHLKEIHQSDLSPFSKLMYLNLKHNDIEFLEDGLFAYNPELVVVNFNSNKIIHIGVQVFNNLNKIAWLYLQENTCINMYAQNNQTAVREIISQAKVKCQSYSGKLIVSYLKNIVDHAQFELSKSITDLSQATATQSEFIGHNLNISHYELKTYLQDIKSTQDDISQLISSQSQTCSEITGNILKIRQSLININDEVAKKSNSTDIKSSISSLKFDMTSKFSTIGSNVNEVKVIQQEIQQKSINMEKSLKDLTGSQTSTTSAITDKITKVDKSLSEIIKHKSDDIQRSMTSSHDELKRSLSDIKTVINNQISTLHEQISQKTENLDKSINDRITNLDTSLNIAFRKKEANITNDVNSRTFNLSERITNIETAMNNGMMSIKDDLASEIIAMNDTTNIRMTIIEDKISNLTSILQDFIQSSTRSSNQFQSELKDRLQITNYKIEKSSIIQDYSKSMLIGSCALLVTLVLVIIYKKILTRPDDLDY